MYSHTEARPRGLGEVSLSGGRCFEQWFQPITHHRPPGWDPVRTIRGDSDTRYQVIGMLQDQVAELNFQQNWQTRPTGENFRLVVVRELKDYTQSGDVQSISWNRDQPGEALVQFVDGGYQQSGSPFTICGQTFQYEGWPYVIVESWQWGPDPAATAAPIIEVTGTLSTWSPPGVSQVWPMVGGRVVSSVLSFPGSVRFNEAWNSNEIRPGDTLYIKGPDDAVRGHSGIVPAEWRVLESGGGPPVDDPGKVDLPETPDDLPGPVDPDATWPPVDDTDDQPDDQVDDLDDDQVDDGGGYDDGGGTSQPGGPQVGTDGEPDTETPSPAGSALKAGSLALASFLFFFLPGMLGDGNGEWELES